MTLASYIEMSRILTVIASGGLTLGLYHQVWKIFATKSAKDFSVTLIATLTSSEIVWFNYGFAIDEWPIMLITSLNLPAVLLAAIGYYQYGRTPRAISNLPTEEYSAKGK